MRRGHELHPHGRENDEGGPRAERIRANLVGGCAMIKVSMNWGGRR